MVIRVMNSPDDKGGKIVTFIFMNGSELYTLEKRYERIALGENRVSTYYFIDGRTLEVPMRDRSLGGCSFSGLEAIPYLDILKKRFLEWGGF